MIVAIIGTLVFGYIAGVVSVICWAHYGMNKPKYWWRKEKRCGKRNAE